MQCPPVVGPGAWVSGVKDPAACFLSACLPTERNRFITFYFNLTRTHTPPQIHTQKLNVLVVNSMLFQPWRAQGLLIER